MTRMYVLALLWMALAALSWAGLVVGVPACERSRFRYRLWRLRDEIVDALVNGDVRRSEAVDELLRHVELGIQTPNSISPINLVIARGVTRAEGQPAYRLADVESLPERERQRIQGWRAEFMHVLSLQLLHGSLSGWVFFWTALPFVALRRLRRRLSQGRPISTVPDSRIPVREAVERRVGQEVRRHPVLLADLLKKSEDRSRRSHRAYV